MHEPHRLVSIVTVTFNSAATLTDTLVSVANQTYPYLQHVLVDGGSSDGTLELIKQAHETSTERIVWISECDHGIYDAMNKGIRMARGDVIGILNSDDFFADEHVVADIIQKLDETGASALYADLVFVDSVHTESVQRTWVAGRGQVHWGWNPPHPTLYITAETYKQLGLYRPDYRISSDYDFMLRLFNPSARVKVTYLPRIIVNMRNGGRSTRSITSNITGFREAQHSLLRAGIRFPLLVNALRVFRKLRQPFGHRLRAKPKTRRHCTSRCQGSDRSSPSPSANDG